MKRKKTPFKQFLASMLYLGILCFGAVMFAQVEANAAEQTVSVDNGDSQTVTVHPGDTGTIVPNYAPDPETGSEAQLVYEYSKGWFFDSECIAVDAYGNFEARALGRERIEVTGWDSEGTEVFSAVVFFENQVDMEPVKLQKTTLSGYLFPTYIYGDHISYDQTEFDIKVNSPTVLSEDLPGIDLSCKTGAKDVWAYASLSDNLLHLTIYAQKKCTAKLTVTIAEKKFELTITLKPVKISASSVLMERGKTKQLRLVGYSGAVTWSSSDPAAAQVSKSGVVKGKKIGNAVITATAGGHKIGCAVSVTSAKLKKVCQRAAYIGTNWKYDQNKRTLSGYYDCSSLVWKAYKEYAGINFGSSSYTGTTVTESAWCRDHKCLIKGGYTQKRVDKMLLQPGDLVFKSQDGAKPFETTYHVEMFTGYTCIGYDNKGKPTVIPLWAARDAGYGAMDGSLLARPIR